MSQFFFLVQIVAPIFAVMGAGYAMRKIDVLTAEADRSLSRLTVFLLAPALALDTIIGNDALRQPANWLLPPIFGFLSIVLGLAIGRLGARLLGKPNDRVRRTFIYTSSIQNYGYIALPLCTALFDRGTMGVLFAFMLGVELAFWSIALWTLTGGRERRSWREFITPPIVTIPTAMVLNAWDAEHWIPPFLDTTFHLLGVCAVPLALLLSGALIADYMNLRSLQQGGRTVLAASLVRLLAAPAVLVLCAKFLPLDPSLRAVLVLQAAMPSGIFPIVLTKAHHGDVPTALRVVLGTSLIGMLTIPLWLTFGLAWIKAEP